MSRSGLGGLTVSIASGSVHSVLCRTTRTAAVRKHVDRCARVSMASGNVQEKVSQLLNEGFEEIKADSVVGSTDRPRRIETGEYR